MRSWSSNNYDFRTSPLVHLNALHSIVAPNFLQLSKAKFIGAIPIIKGYFSPTVARTSYFLA